MSIQVRILYDMNVLDSNFTLQNSYLMDRATGNRTYDYVDKTYSGEIFSESIPAMLTVVNLI
jgi:hypothetical protein